MSGEEERLLREKQAKFEQHKRLFNEHTEHFEQLDDVLERFARGNNLTLAKNDWNRPCRVLRRAGNPSYVIEILQEGNWHKIPFRNDLPHTLVVAGYCEDEAKNFVYQMNEEIAYFVHFSTIKEHLLEYLQAALPKIQQWSADVILREGARSEHPRKGRQGGEGSSGT